MNSERPTGRVTMVHVLLRGPNAMQGEMLKVGGVSVAAMGPGTKERFPDTDVRPGDVYAVAWVAESQITEVLARLRRSATVIDAATDEGDKASTRRRRKVP